MNAGNLFGMNCISHLLNFLSWSISLHILLTINLLILHTVLPGVFFVFTGTFLSVRDPPPPFENLYTVISELGHDDTLDLGEVKLCWRVLIHLIISALQISGSFPPLQENGILKIPTVTAIYVTTTPFCKHYFQGCIWIEIVTKIVRTYTQDLFTFLPVHPLMAGQRTMSGQKCLSHDLFHCFAYWWPVKNRFWRSLNQTGWSFWPYRLWFWALYCMFFYHLSNIINHIPFSKDGNLSSLRI